MEFMHSPLRVSIDVTGACNLSCRHCRHGSQACDELTLAELSFVIDDVGQMGVFRLVISGGEPFLRQDMLEILLRALRTRVGRVFVSTNGTCIPQHVLDKLTAFRRRLTFKISLDGAADFHDAWRGQKGAFAKASASIRLLTQRGFDVQVTTTLMRSNLDSLSWLLEYVAETGSSRHALVEVIPVGRAGLEMALSTDERIRAAESIRFARLRGGHCEIISKIAFVDGRCSGFFCSGGIEECGVLSDGRIVGCRLMPDVVAGNVREMPLSRVWSRSERFSLFRDITPGRLRRTCRNCKMAAACLGGCHAYARAVGGSVYGPDPRCPRASREPAGETGTCSAH